MQKECDQIQKECDNHPIVLIHKRLNCIESFLENSNINKSSEDIINKDEFEKFRTSIENKLFLLETSSSTEDNNVNYKNFKSRYLGKIKKLELIVEDMVCENEKSKINSNEEFENDMRRKIIGIKKEFGGRFQTKLDELDSIAKNGEAIRDKMFKQFEEQMELKYQEKYNALQAHYTEQVKHLESIMESILDENNNRISILEKTINKPSDTLGLKEDLAKILSKLST